MLLSVVAGLMGALTFPGRRSLRRCVAGALLGPLTAAAMVGPVALGYDADALARRPVLSGQLGSAEELLGRVARLETPYGSVESRSRVLAERLAGLYSASLTDEISRSDGEVVLLHVSDLHLSAVGAAMTAELARSFQVDAVIDSGDITSFGFEPEAEFVAPLDDLEVPYLLVAGNHDSAGVRGRLAASAVVRLLDGDSVDIRGVRVLGIGDPTMTALERVPRAQLDRQYRNQFAENPIGGVEQQ